MRAPRLVIALVLALIGLVWIGQGIGLIGGSAMSGSSFWAIVGAILVALGVVIALRERARAART
jgi:glucose dehydrogenase